MARFRGFRASCASRPASSVDPGMKAFIIIALLAASADAAPLDDFEFALHEYTHEYTRPWAITRFHRFEVGPKCFARFTDKDQAVIASAAQAASHVVNYAKEIGADDWSTIESQRNNDRETNKKIVSDMMAAFRPKLSITVRVEGDDCDAGDRALWMQYWVSITKALEDYPPKSGKVAIVLDVTPKTKVMSATVRKDGTFVFTGSRDIEPTNNWGAPIESTFRRAAGR
jgi:hypothetical protein